MWPISIGRWIHDGSITAAMAKGNLYAADSRRTGQYVNCCRWMSVGIPAFNERISPLVEVLEPAYQKAGKRKKKAIQNIALKDPAWSERHKAAFKDMQTSILTATKLSYPRKGKVLRLYTHASERNWSGVVTQTDEYQLNLQIEEQANEPMAFVGRTFNETAERWTTFDKEGIAIFRTFEKLDYLHMGGQIVRVFTGHLYLLFIFAPLFLIPPLGRHVVSKVQRWALYLSRFEHTIKHIDGVKNVFADILTRWLKGYRRPKFSLKTVASFALDSQMVQSATDEEFVWPDIEMLRQSQQEFHVEEGLERDPEDDLLKKDNHIWIPQQDVRLQIKILVTSHCGATGTEAVTQRKALSGRTSIGSLLAKTPRRLWDAVFIAQ